MTVTDKFDDETDSQIEPSEKRTDEWSECLTLIGKNEDRAAFTRLFRHFAPLMKAFALSGSTLSANNADELVQEVMLKVWQKAGAFNAEKAAASTWIYTIARATVEPTYFAVCRNLTPRYQRTTYQAHRKAKKRLWYCIKSAVGTRLEVLSMNCPATKPKSSQKCIWRANLILKSPESWISLWER